jgi:hypothetical protein
MGEYAEDALDHALNLEYLGAYDYEDEHPDDYKDDNVFLLTKRTSRDYKKPRGFKKGRPFRRA